MSKCESGKVYDCYLGEKCQNHYIWCKACTSTNGRKMYYPKKLMGDIGNE